VATIALAAATFLGFGAAVLQWRVLSSTDEKVAAQVNTMRGQLTEMKEDRRAWVSLLALIPVTIAANVPVRLSVSVENSGESPAINVVHRFNGQTIDVPNGVRVSATWIAPQLPSNDGCTNGKTVEGVKIIYPSTINGYKDTIETLADPSEIPIVNALVAGEKTLYIQGCFSYVTAERLLFPDTQR
jgi:hypothetical protein